MYQSISTRLAKAHPVPAMTLALAIAWMVLPNHANAQWGYGYRGGIAVVPVPPPVIGPGYYFGSPRFVAPVGPPVRIRTPFFSMDLNTGPVVPSYGYSYRVPAPVYRYESYRLAPAYPGPSSLDPRYRVPSRGNVISPLDESDRNPYRQTPSAGRAPRGMLSLEELALSAETLESSLLRQGEEGEIWLDYLDPDSIINAATRGEYSDRIAELKTNYAGVTFNPELRRITMLPGFESTYEQLILWTQQPSKPEPPASSAREQRPLDDSLEPTDGQPEERIEEQVEPSGKPTTELPPPPGVLDI